LTTAKIVPFEEQKILKRATAAEQVYNFIVSCGDEGAMLMEIYDASPKIGQRQIRYCVREFVSQKLLNTQSTCRCGRGTVYIAKSAMKNKPYKNKRGRTMHIINRKLVSKKQYSDGKVMGADGKRVEV